MAIEEFIKSRIASYKKYLPKKDAEGRDIEDSGVWKDRGNILMAKRVIWLYEKELEKIKAKQEDLS